MGSRYDRILIVMTIAFFALGLCDSAAAADSSAIDIHKFPRVGLKASAVFASVRFPEYVDSSFTTDMEGKSVPTSYTLAPVYVSGMPGILTLMFKLTGRLEAVMWERGNGAFIHSREYLPDIELPIQRPSTLLDFRALSENLRTMYGKPSVYNYDESTTQHRWRSGKCDIVLELSMGKLSYAEVEHSRR